MHYQGKVYRPPSEAKSLIIQVTLGCSHNKCTFCPMFKEKHFKMRPYEEVYADLREARESYSYVERIFFADGDAMCLATDKLLALLGAAKAFFPECKRIGIYARANNISRKSDEELMKLRDAGLYIAYIGAESGSAEVLKRVNKGETPEEVLEAVQRVESLGIKASVTFLLGLGGKGLFEEHAVETGKMIAAMGASYVGLLTIMPAPGTPLFKDTLSGKFKPLNSREVAQELEIVLENAICEKECIIRSNHASNKLVIAGTLPQDRERLLAQVRSAQ